MRTYSTVVVLVLALTGCAYERTTPQVSRQDAAPHNSVAMIARLKATPDPEVKREAKSARGNSPVYTVLGKSYQVMNSARGFRQEGLASWYGTKFHGRETSSGERFDIYKLTAAHKHLPLPTYVRVTNLVNGKKTLVRVNDRGPFHGDRIIDLSYAAAVKLGFHHQGTARVRIEVVVPAEVPINYIVQAGAFRDFARADRSHRELQTMTGLPGVVVKIPTDGFYRVRLGPVPADALPRLRALLQAADYGKPKIIPVR